MKKKQLEKQLSEIENLHLNAIRNGDTDAARRLESEGKEIQRQLEYLQWAEEAHEDDYNKLKYEQ